MQAFETLSDSLKMLFDPYVSTALPPLLAAFADSRADVRDAAAAAARAIMANLTGHGVKVVMPKLLAAFDETKWRTKEAAINLLGAFAYCAPKQLSACLPQVVPKLVLALTDTHPKVQGSGREALRQIG